MTAERRQTVVGWLETAESDLAYAKLGLDNGDYYFSGAVYHCQQAAEKALKALCCFHGIKPPKTHDLVALLEKLKDAADLGTFNQSAARLTPLATEFRYPDFIDVPGQETVETAFLDAKAIVEAVKMLTSRGQA
jgi:HEPN domain-containing protein